MCDDDDGQFGPGRGQTLENRGFGVDVDGARRLVENERLRPAQDGSGQRDSLTLSTGEADPALAHFGVESLLRSPHDAVHADQRQGLPERIVSNVLPAPGQVPPYGLVEKEGFLRDVGNPVPPELRMRFVHGDAVQSDRSAVGDDQACDRVEQRGLARA